MDKTHQVWRNDNKYCQSECKSRYIKVTHYGSIRHSTLLKYSLNPVNISEKGTFICLKVIRNLGYWIVVIKYIMKNSSKTFQTTPQRRLQRGPWNLLILSSCICLDQARPYLQFVGAQFRKKNYHL